MPATRKTMNSMNSKKAAISLNSLNKSILWILIVGACIATVPLAANAGLLILETAPNPRHPPQDLLGEAVGWAIIGLLISAVCTVIGESITNVPDPRSVFSRHKGLILGSGIGVVLALLIGSNLAFLQMASVDGQAITSVPLGLMSGATVAFIGAVAGVVMGFVLRRAVLAVAA